MKAAWYERKGPASAVLQLGERPDPAPGDAATPSGLPGTAIINDVNILVV